MCVFFYEFKGEKIMKGVVGLVITLTVVSGGFINEPTNVVYHNGEQSVGHVDCVVDSNPENLIWQFQRLGSENSAVFYVHPNFIGTNASKYMIRTDALSSGNFTLTIFDLSRDDSGKYTCQAERTAKAANLTVADPPEVPLFTIDEELVENRTATFSCRSVGGFPLPTYTWLLNGSPLPSEYYKDVVENGEVAISRLTTEMKNTYHESTLMCRTSNILRSSETSREMNVQFSPRVSIQQQNLIVLRNGPFDLTCQMSTNPDYTVLSWLTGNAVINGANAAIYRVASGVEMDSLFRCRVENIHGTGEGSTAVTVHYGPDVSIESGDALAIDEWDTLSVNCMVDATPAATVKWMKGEQVMSNSAALNVVSISRQDRGEYRCVATNTVRPTLGVHQQLSSSASLTVTVNYAADKPELSVNPVSYSGYYMAEVKVQLECAVADAGSPEAKFKWHKTRNGGTALGFTGRQLQIDVPQVTDTDDYWCEAVNPAGSVMSEVKSLKFMDIPELMAAGSKEDNISLSTVDYSIQCTYKAFPSPSIQWYKEGELLSDGTQYHMSEVEEEGDNYPYVKKTSALLFHNGGDGIAITDSAKYRCLASNRAGESLQNYEKQVNVIYSPHYEGYGKVAANLSSIAAIPCEVSSYPPVTSITFKKGNTELTDSSKYTLGDVEYGVGGVAYRQGRELSISNIDNADYGVYICVAVNSQGVKEFEIVMSKTSKPDAPTHLVYSDLSWDSVVLSWQAGFDGGYTQSFSVHELSGSMEKVKEGVRELQFTVTGLTPMTEYTFRVSSYNIKGSSESYVEQVLTTPKLYIPVATLLFGEDDMTLQVLVNTTKYCTKIQGSMDGLEYKDISNCSMNARSTPIFGKPYTSYRALTCVVKRPDVCSESPSITAKAGSPRDTEDKRKVITIAVVVSVFIVIIIVIIVAVAIVLRRKGRLQKSATNNTKTGHINPIMTPNGVPGEVRYSNHGVYNINSHLEMDDEIDSLPYGELKNHRESPELTKQPFDNLDYVYASVQKKSSEQNKLNEAAAYQAQAPPPTMNIRDPASISDNSEQDDYDDQLSSPYQGPDDLAEFLGPDVMAFRRLPSLSESGYSTPDSKLKKVVYEVIV